MYWQIQDINQKALYPDVIWDQPENRLSSGSVLLIGGNSQSFNLVSTAYQESKNNIFSSTGLILPISLEKILKNYNLSNCWYVKSNLSGGFATESLALIIDVSHNYDCLMLIGNFGHSSETTILIEKLVSNINKQFIVHQDSFESLMNSTIDTVIKPNLLFVLDFNQLQKLLIKLKSLKPLTSKLNLMQAIEILHDISLKYNLKIITNLHSNIIVAVSGKISITKINPEINWSIKTAIQATSWLINQPQKPYETLTSSIYELYRYGAARRT